MKNLNSANMKLGQIGIWAAVGLTSAMGLAGVGVWQIAPCEFQGAAKAEYSEEINVPYDEFRTMMVRNNATQAIVEHGGMELIDEEIINLHVDLSRDKRPLLNAILRRSKSCVTASKRLTVAVNNSQIQADKLVLVQNAEITPEQLDVSSFSEGPAGDLKSYHASLHAEPSGDTTLVCVTVEMQLCKELGKLFHSEAQSQLNAAAHQTVQQQCAALQQFALANAKE